MVKGLTIGVVTVTYESASVIDGFIQSLLSQTCSGFKLYVIDNASKDDTVIKLGKYNDPCIEVTVNNENTGVAAGNNQGIRRAISDGCTYVLLINNDTEFHPQLIGGLVNCLENNGCDVIVPKIMYHAEHSRIWFAGGHFNRLRAFDSVHEGMNAIDLGQYDTARFIDYAPTCCMLIRTPVFKTVGMMDEKYFVYYDDTDFCYRLRKAGIKIFFLPSVTILHKVGITTGGGASVFTIRYCTRNHVYFLKKHIFFPLRIFWMLFLYMVIWIRLMIGRESWSVVKLRHHSFFEGLRL